MAGAGPWGPTCSSGAIYPHNTPYSPASGTGPWGIAISTVGIETVYTGCGGSNNISCYGIQSDGTLQLLSTPTVSAGGSGRAPRYLVVSPDGKFVYAAHFANSEIGIYPRSLSTGILSTPTFKACSAGPFGIALTPDGLYLYTSHGSGSIVSQFSVNTTTGALTNQATATLAGPNTGQGCAVSPDGLSFYVCGNGGVIGMYSISSGALTAIGTGTVTNTGWPAALIVTPDNKSVIVANDTSATIGVWTRDLVTTVGNLTSVGTQGTINGPFGIACSNDGTAVWMPGSDGNHISQWTRNTSTNALTKKVPFLIPADSTCTAIAASTAGPYSMVAHPNGLYAYCTMAGAGNRVAQFNVRP